MSTLLDSNFPNHDVRCYTEERSYIDQRCADGRAAAHVLIEKPPWCRFTDGRPTRTKPPASALLRARPPSSKVVCCWPSFRRMMAYSSIAHAGCLFYAMLGDGPGRFQAVVFYIVAYGLLNALAFAALPAHADDTKRDQLDTIKGLYQRNPFAAIAIGIAMLSLAGLPPFPGFVAKFLIFKNVLAAGYTTYAVIGLVGS